MQEHLADLNAVLQCCVAMANSKCMHMRAYLSVHRNGQLLGKSDITA